MQEHFENFVIFAKISCTQIFPVIQYPTLLFFNVFNYYPFYYRPGSREIMRLCRVHPSACLCACLLGSVEPIIHCAPLQQYRATLRVWGQTSVFVCQSKVAVCLQSGDICRPASYQRSIFFFLLFVVS